MHSQQIVCSNGSCKSCERIEIGIAMLANVAYSFPAGMKASAGGCC